MKTNLSEKVRVEWAIKGGLCVLPSAQDPEQLVRTRTSVAVAGGKIVGIGDDAHEGAAEIFDATGLTILPGVIDSQVHFREPGLTFKEDLETGTRAAILGGVTSVFEMPNTKPPTVSVEAFHEKVRLASGRVWTDVAFFVGATPENYLQLKDLEILKGCCAVKIFMGSSTGNLLIADEVRLRDILSHGQRRVAVHAEDEARLQARRGILATPNPTPALHPVWRDELTALTATDRLVRLARETNRPVHVLHVTTAEEMELLARSRDVATVEVTPQHLTLSAPECYEILGTLAQMNPPIRDGRHQAALWKAVNDGTVSVIGSDHAPHTLAEKAQVYPNTPSGMPGVQTLVPLMLDHVYRGRLTLERFVELSCRNNARLYRAKGKGEIRLGNDADFTVVDLGMEKTITNSWIASRCGWTPFDGYRVRGWPVATVVRGQVVMRDGQVMGPPIGKLIEFNH